MKGFTTTLGYSGGQRKFSGKEISFPKPRVNVKIVRQLDVTKLKRQVDKAMFPRLSSIGAQLTRYIYSKISQGFTQDSGPSRPYNPPHVDTGRLRASLSWILIREKGQIGVRVGANADGRLPVEYALGLETGTEHVEQRPYLKTSVSEMGGVIQMILSGKKGSMKLYEMAKPSGNAQSMLKF
jgi:hypothetical protein